MRTIPNQRLDNKVFSMASTLFGFGENPIKEVSNPAIVKPLQLSGRIIAIYPAIIEEAFSSTMDNYRKYIASYNFKTQAENELIQAHNNSVKEFCKTTVLNEVQIQYKRLFLLHNAKNNNPRGYNEAVNQFCNDYGLIVEKKKIQTVKYATEVVFQNLLHLYNSQLMKRNEKFIKGGIASKRTIEEFKINSFLVTQLKRNEVSSIAICTKTVRNHRKRLEEAGVFVEYHFAGRNRPIEVHINPEILVILDVYTSKIKRSENKELRLTYWNVLPDNNESTRTFINENKKKENVENISQDIRSSSEALTPSHLFFTGTHTSKEAMQTKGAGGDPETKEKTLSDKLHELILHPQELAENLANGDYHNYKPIDIRYLYKEAFSGTLNNEEFRELAIQDFFKSISKIYKSSTPFAGSYKKAINLYYQNKWIAFTGNSFNKSVLVDEISQMRWRIEWARKWFVKNEFAPLFPYNYFDMTRKTAKEVGFEYTKAKWNEHLKAIAKYDALKKKQQANATKRKETINHSKKCENAITRFFKNKLTYSQLFDYVEQNLPKQYLEKLPDLILKKSLKTNEKSIAITQEEAIKYSFFEF
ncbi:hypothetical protein OX284_005720 [Flavobacterium sp. SUN046]|uniref:hypothetical protein n=1 Tax=Flavobacterium sp. SUN046 TaxID=3002440 RepID=UPI002DB75C22|nr:hypothetical protein [Flavobacterium sp. SUN046]MEC4048916.1 hypothetical protein [Flavobacterium sp. SUN046]